MKLLVDALIGKFGSFLYSVELLYGDADSKTFPEMPSGIADANLMELARKFTHGVVLKNDTLRHAAYFYDSTSEGSCCGAKSIDLTFGVPTCSKYVLTRFEGLPADELHNLLTSCQNAVQNPLVSGKFTYHGLIHDKNVVIG